MKTIDDLLAYERNRIPDPEPLIQKPNDFDTHWEAKMKKVAEELRSVLGRPFEREIRMYTSREGHLVYQDALRQCAEEDKQMIWGGGRASGKSDATLAMGMALLAPRSTNKK